MNKKGLNDVVTTVLLILIVVIAVGVIWVFVNASISRTTSSFDIGVITASFSIVPSSVKINALLEYMLFSVQRNAGEGEVNAISVIVEDSTGATKSFRQSFSRPLNEFEKQQVLISWKGSGLNSNIKSISVVPTVVTDDKRELPGKTTDLYKVSGIEDSGLVAYWDFEGGTTEAFKDKTGKNTDVTSNGVTAVADTLRAGMVATFDGVNDYIQVGDQDFLDFDTGSFSIAFWVKTDMTPGGVTRYILHKSATSPSKGYFVGFIRSSTNVQQASIRVADTTRITLTSNSDNDPNLNEWRFYVFVMDKENTKEISNFIFNKDSDLSSRAGNPVGITAIKSTSNNVPLIIGWDQTSYAAIQNLQTAYQGKLDDIMIFNRALNSEEIGIVYNATWRFIS